MNGNCHFLFGATVGVNIDSISEFLPRITNSPETVTLLVLGGLIGGVLPDIDNPSSHIGKLTVPVSTLIGKWGEMTGKTKSRHRGLLHDGIVYIFGLILSYMYLPSLIGLCVGCLSHLFLDMFNPAGVPFLFGVKHLRLAKIPSDSKGAVALTWFSIFGVVAICTILKLGIFT